MKAAVIYKAGGPEQFVLEDRPQPSVKPGWSLVKVKGFGVNHSEIFTRQGLSPSVQFPRVLGIECVGVIEETTDPVKLPLGRTVISIMGEMGRAFDGGYAEYTLLPNDQIYPVETDLDWETLAALPETYYTAFGSMLNLDLQADDRILVRAGASGVGVAFAKLVRAKFPSISLTASVRHLDKEAQLKAAGFDQVILDRDGRLETDQGFTKVFELVGPKTITDSISHMEEGGIICSTGQLGGQWYLEDFDPITELGHKRIYLTGFASGAVSLEKLQSLLDYVKEYQVPVKAEKIYKLDDIAQAHAYLESPAAFGKVIVLNEESEGN